MVSPTSMLVLVDLYSCLCYIPFGLVVFWLEMEFIVRIFW